MDMHGIEIHGYIKLIEFALGNKRFSKNAACEKSGLSEKQFDFARNRIFVLSAYQEQNFSRTEEQEWELSPEAFFNYLQYLEFKHAVRSARSAQYISIAAIIISGVLALASLLKCT